MENLFEALNELNQLEESIVITNNIPERTEEGIIICPDSWEDGWKY